MPTPVSINGKPSIVCQGFSPKPDLGDVECFGSNNVSLAPGVKTKEQYTLGTPLLTLVGEICIHCANQTCENNR